MTVRSDAQGDPATYPNKRLRSEDVGGMLKGKGSANEQMEAIFSFNTDKSPLDVRCFPILDEDQFVGSFSITFPLLAADWGNSAKENLTLSLDKRESQSIGQYIVLALRDQNGRKIGHFEDFRGDQQKFMKLFFELNDDVSAEATISFPHPFLLAEIKIGIPRDTIVKYLSPYHRNDNLAFFLLHLKCGSRLGKLPKVIVPTNPSLSANEKLQPTGLVSKLLEFQKTTVGWMLEREGSKLGTGNGMQVEVVPIPPTRSLIELIPGFYFDIASGFYTENKDAGQYELIQGGILCDEMGMGKTLMVLSVILLNRLRNIEKIAPFAGDLIPAKTSLIIVPPSILNQWILEADKNTPGLSYYTFEGGKSVDSDGEPVDGSYLAEFDIVFTTYNTLQKEIYAASSGRDGDRRRNRKVNRRSCPLTEILWYRVVLDEAQMVENTVSNASAMACKIPRYISWTVTGTPCPKTGTLEDMKGLFLFANSELYTWSSIFKLPDRALATILSPVLHRDSKDHCKDELVLPKQEDQTFYIPFTKVEEQYYDDFVHEAVEAIGPFPEIPDLKDLEYENARCVMKAHEDHKNARFNMMAKWFLRLRQTCCHPKASLEGRRLLGGRARTMEEVRDTMLSRCNSIIHGGERALVGNAIDRGQILALQKNYEGAIELFMRQLPFCQEKRHSIEEELKIATETKENEEVSAAISDEGENTVTRLKRDIRNWNEVEHRVLYFIALVYADLNDESNEVHYYELATDVQESMLSELQESYQFHRKQAIATCNANLVDFQRELLIPVDMHGGIMTNRIFTELEPIEDMLNDQWDFIRSWRDLIKEALISATGSDFDNGLKDDEIAGIFVEMLGVLLLFRKEVLTGEAKNHPFCDSCGEAVLKGKLTDCAHIFCDVCCKELKPTRRGTCDCPLCQEKIVVADMDDIFSSLKPRADPDLAPGHQTNLFRQIKNLQLDPKSDSYKSVLAKFKAVLSRYDLPVAERDLARQASRHMAKHLEIQLRHVHTLEKELATFKNLQNARAAYYRLLRKIGTSVTPSVWGKPLDEELSILLTAAESWESRIKVETSKKQFLLNRATNQEESNGSKICLICTNQILTGYTFPCGHFSCSDCFIKWNIKHQKCHACNTPMDHNACHKTNELPSLRPVTAPSAIASELQAKVSSVKINESVGSKMNMVTKHITLLLKENPLVKILCFSQWDTVLKMFAESLVKQKIGFINLEGSGWDKGTEKELRMGKKGLAVSTFVENPNVSCFLLHAKSQSAGLSLVAATHVFLLEPMIHKGLEDQAIGRIHRIGQTKPTYVWRYIIQGTVEEYLVKDCETEEATDRQVKIKRRDEGETVAQSQLLNFFEPMIIEKNNHLRLLEKEFEENENSYY